MTALLHEIGTSSYIVARTARKAHRCDDRLSRHCAREIKPGDRYILVKAFPEDSNDRMWVGKSCLYCSAIRSRDYLLYPIPETQDNRYWDIDSELLDLGDYDLRLLGGKEPAAGTRRAVIHGQHAS